MIVYMFASDQGGDERGSHGIVQGELARLQKTLYIRQWCLLHAMHLIVKGQLKSLDMFKYFSDVAKLMHVFRTPSFAKLLYNAIVDIAGRHERHEPILIQLLTSDSTRIHS